MHVSTMSRVGLAGKSLGLAALAAALTAMTPAPVAAQDLPVEISGGVTVPSLYYFRGYRQEVGPALTLQPFVDVGGTLFEGDGTLQSATLNVGSWNSIHTGTNSDADSIFYLGGSFYETDFYAALGLGFSGWSLTTTYTAYMYPSPDVDAIHEIAFNVGVDHMLAPYVILAQEFAEDDPGTYLELGVGPSWPITADEEGATLTVPVKLAFDLKDYYGGDSYLFTSLGGRVDYPLTEQWGLNFGAELLLLGDTLEDANINEDFDTSSTGFVAFVGISFSF